MQNSYFIFNLFHFVQTCLPKIEKGKMSTFILTQTLFILLLESACH